MKLYPIQQLAVDKLARVLRAGNIAGNFSSTGTGKTLMSLVLAGELGFRPLVVAPLMAHATWKQWADKLGVTPEGIINAEQLRTGKTDWAKITGYTVSFKNRKKIERPNFEWDLDPERTLVLWDEMHKGLLGKDTITGRLAAMLRPQGIKTVLASATPFDSPLNARTLGYLFNLHRWTAASFYSWCRAHGCRPSMFHSGLEFNVGSQAAQGHLARINAAIRDRCVALTVEDLGEYFPEGSIVEPYLIKLSDRDEAEARRIYDEMEEAVKKTKHSNPLTAQLRARQRCELLKIPAMAELVVDSIAEGYNVFVSLCFIDSVDLMIAELAKLGVTSAVKITGDEDQTARNAAVNLFNAEFANVMVASSAGGESISLHQLEVTQRPRTSLISPSYSASQLVQALGRIRRAGMIQATMQRIVLCAGTIEERVAAKLQAKSNAIDTITDSDLE